VGTKVGARARDARGCLAGVGHISDIFRNGDYLASLTDAANQTRIRNGRLVPIAGRALRVGASVLNRSFEERWTAAHIRTLNFAPNKIADVCLFVRSRVVHRPHQAFFLASLAHVHAHRGRPTALQVRRHYRWAHPRVALPQLLFLFVGRSLQLNELTGWWVRRCVLCSETQ